ncbi:MAG: phage/plasmid primase, P4 family [Azospirillaceae bacterium]
MSGGEIRDAALAYAAQGMPVFPCRPDKRPRVKEGFKAATTDPAMINTWWKDWPDAMIGIPTGEPSGLIALDVDVDPEKGLDGQASLAALEDEHGPLPATRTQRTPRGGTHHIFAWPGHEVPSSVGKLGRGLDVRGDGGYVILAPSVNGKGGSYRVERDCEPVQAPDWLLDLVTRSGKARQEPKSTPCTALSPLAVPHPYVEAALSKEVERVASAPEGERNDALNSAAFSLGQLISGGCLDERRVKNALVEAAKASGLVNDDGLASVHRTIASGLEAGRLQPRGIPKRSILKAGHQVRMSTSYQKVLDRPVEATEDGLARAFAETHGDDLRYCHGTGSWFIWSGAYWQQDRTEEAFHRARELCRLHNPKPDQRLARATTAGAVERFAKADPVFAVTADRWDTDPFLLGTPGGTVDLRTGRLRSAHRRDFITKVTAVAPDAGGDCPTWRRFLAEATNGDEALQRFLQQLAGYCLTGDVSEHSLFFLYGPGGNGKSVFVNVLTGILGAYSTTAAMDSFTAARGERHSTDLAMLRGARLVSASETEEGRSWAESRIKQLTGGDPITARCMRQDNFEYRPQFKLVIVGNHKPILSSVDDAARRRFNIVPFTHTPTNPDPYLEAKLKSEWPAILVWAIEGALDWHQNRLVRPQVVTQATASYFSEQDLVGEWLEACCEKGESRFTDTTANLFRSWSDFAIASGEHPGSTKKLSMRLQRLGYELLTETPGHRKQRGLQGIRVKPVDTSGQWQNRMEAGDDEF